jgi:hypothetical protein
VPCASVTVLFVPSCNRRFSLAAVVKKDLLIMKPILLSHLSSISGADAVHPKVELSPGIHKGLHQVASCRKQGPVYTQSSVHGVADCQPPKFDALGEELVVFPINFSGGDTKEGR